MSSETALSLDNPVFRGYIFYSSLLILKMLSMSLLTGLARKKYKAFANPEDAKMENLKVKTDENVERVRRAHLNDLENIPVFFATAFGYLLTNPAVVTALALFKAFTVARFLHTTVYAIVVVRQPARGICFGVGYLITIYMAAQTALHFLALLYDGDETLFFAASFASIVRNPDPYWTLWTFRAYTLLRLGHVLVNATEIVPAQFKEVPSFLSKCLTSGLIGSALGGLYLGGYLDDDIARNKFDVMLFASCLFFTVFI